MPRLRTALFLADGAGRQLWRGSLGPRVLAGLGLALALGACGAAALAWHGLRLRPRAALAAELRGRREALYAKARALEDGVPAVRATLEDNRAVLAELERKSGFTFVALAEGGVPAAAGEVALDELRARGDRLALWLGGLAEYWHDAERRLANTPAIRPARTAWLSSSFGVRVDPISHYTVMHKGLDLAGFIGMLVYAPADGRVIWTGLRGSYGQVVVLDHGWGLQTHFAHLSRALVTQGDAVHRGEPIAEMGNTGKSTGPHLHYEVRQDGYPVDPRHFILD